MTAETSISRPEPLQGRLKVALLVDDLGSLPAWVHRMVEIIQAGDYARVTLLVHSGSAGPARTVRRGVVDAALLAVQDGLVGRARPARDPLRRIDAGALLEGVDSIEVTLVPDGAAERLGDADVAAIKARGIDVLACLRHRRLRGGVLSSARYGVWWLRHGDPAGGGAPLGYREVMESCPVTGSALEKLDDSPAGGVVLCRSYSSTDDMSVARTLAAVYWKSLNFIPRKLRELHRDGAGYFFARAERTHGRLQFQDQPLYTEAGSGQRMGLLYNKLLQKIRRRRQAAVYFPQWILLYDTGPDVSTDPSRFRELLPPKTNFWADPFVVFHDGRHYIFFEDYVYATQRGHLAVLALDLDGRHGDPVPILQRPYHLSYPFIFKFDGDWYMIPESAANRTIELYKCAEFPHRWEFQHNLMENCVANDATLLEWDGRWWMFVNMVEVEGSSSWDELFLFHGASPLSTDWTPHPLNPIVSDVRSARPAGRIFARDGRLYRPSQNSATRYGYGFNICEITRLSIEEYAETVVSAVEPGWNPDIIATHTLNYDAGMTVIDAQKLRSKR